MVVLEIKSVQTGEYQRELQTLTKMLESVLDIILDETEMLREVNETILHLESKRDELAYQYSLSQDEELLKLLGLNSVTLSETYKRREHIKGDLDSRLNI